MRLNARAVIGVATFWQTFGRLRLESNQFMQRERDFSNRFSCVYGPRKNYALYEVTRLFFDTVGVWGSNPHAPTIPHPHPEVSEAAC